MNQMLDLNSLHSQFSNLIDEYQQQYPATELIAVESGRFLVGPAGIFVTRVVDIKYLYGKCFVVLDGGVNVFGGHDRYVGARPLPIRVINYSERALENLTLCGPLCTPLDRLAANVVLPRPRIGSLVVFYLAGAYGYTASPGLFLSHGFPYEVLATGKELKCIRKATSPDDLFLNQSF
jgi:diaminopimelate decarboxylase